MAATASLVPMLGLQPLDQAPLNKLPSEADTIRLMWGHVGSSFRGFQGITSVSCSVEKGRGEEVAEREQEELMQYLNSRLGEIKQLKEEMVGVREAKVVWERKLQKSLSAIQGFVSENRKLQEQVVRGGERQAELQEKVAELQAEVTELQAEVTAGERREREGGSGGQAGTLARAKEQFAARLTVYRARFDQLLGA